MATGGKQRPTGPSGRKPGPASGSRPGGTRPGGTRSGGTKASAREKAAAFRAQQQQSERRRRLLIWGGSVVAVIVIVGVILGVALANNTTPKSSQAGEPTGSPSVATMGASSMAASGSAASQASSDTATQVLTGPIGPEGIALEQGSLLAPASSAATGQTVDGVKCSASEQVAYHIHTHLTVYVNGQLRPIPGGVGVVQPVAQHSPQGPFYQASQCYYWVHVHAQDGIIHVEAPNEATYTVGQFFAIWRQPLSTTQVGPASGKVTAFVNGSRYTGNPADIPLKSREDVQFDVGTPVVPPQKVDWSKSQL